VPTCPGCRTKASESGSLIGPDAEYELSKAYLSGQFGLAVDTAKGLRYLRAAAEVGEHAPAQGYLASLYVDGSFGVEKDLEKSFQLYQLSAKQDFALSQVYLGRRYECGEGTTRDLDAAFSWYKKSAEQGDQEVTQPRAPPNQNNNTCDDSQDSVRLCMMIL
jgi:TPR repeat protein